MLTLLLPVDGSEYSDRALDYAIARAAKTRDTVHAHVLTVQAPIVTVNVKLFVSQDSLQTYYREEGTKILEPALAKLAAAGLSAEPHIGVGDAGKVVVDYAVEKAVDEIIMGSHGRGALRCARRLGRAEGRAPLTGAGGVGQIAAL